MSKAGHRATEELLPVDLRRWVDELAPEPREKLARWDIIDARKGKPRKVITESVDDWRDALLAEGVTRAHASEQRSKVLRIIADCGVSRLSDLEVEAVNEYLQGRQDDGDLSDQTRIHYVRALKQFCSWMVETDRAMSSPVHRLKARRGEPQRTYQRRALSSTELAALLEAARKGGKYRRTTGQERAAVYELAATTGLRAKEIRSLRRLSFELEQPNPNVTVEVQHSKHRRQDILPLEQGAADTMRRYFADCPKVPIAPAFNLPEKLGRMMQESGDLRRAKIQTPNLRGEVVDFHSFRVTFITDLARAGVPLNTVQKMARHSDINLTANIYAKVVDEDKRQALAKLA